MSDKDLAISVKNVSKTFKLPHEKQTSLKGVFLSSFKKKQYEKQVALKDINFDVKKGEFFGIVGRNGSGKSTLLKTIAGIYVPDKGSIAINGSLTPFIELGVGFNADLTGRENVFMNGALLGFDRKQMSAMYDEIVDFAELDKFMDQKLSNFSSGMQVRLAFSIAIRAKGDILLLDEVLAVGDSAFQRKCLDFFKDIKKSDKTVILVTHSMGTIEEYCDRAMMIQDSKIATIGDPMKVSLQYEMANSNSIGNLGTKQRPKESKARIIDVSVRSQFKNTEKFSLKDELIVDLVVDVKKKDTYQLRLALFDTSGEYIAGINTMEDIPEFTPNPGIHKLSCHVESGQFAKGIYRLNITLTTDNDLSPELIDAVSTEYGVKLPTIVFTEKLHNKNGKFYLRGKWQEN